MTELTQMRPGDRNPPHSREAEESVIASVLLTVDDGQRGHGPDRPGGLLRPRPPSGLRGHAVAVRLEPGDRPGDRFRGAAPERRAGQGRGVHYLTRLVDIVPSTSNVNHYAGIVDRLPAGPTAARPEGARTGRRDPPPSRDGPQANASRRREGPRRATPAPSTRSTTAPGRRAAPAARKGRRRSPRPH